MKKISYLGAGAILAGFCLCFMPVSTAVAGSKGGFKAKSVKRGGVKKSRFKRSSYKRPSVKSRHKFSRRALRRKMRRQIRGYGHSYRSHQYKAHKYPSYGQQNRYGYNHGTYRRGKNYKNYQYGQGAYQYGYRFDNTPYSGSYGHHYSRAGGHNYDWQGFSVPGRRGGYGYALTPADIEAEIEHRVAERLAHQKRWGLRYKKRKTYKKRSGGKKTLSPQERLNYYRRTLVAPSSQSSAVDTGTYKKQSSNRRGEMMKSAKAMSRFVKKGDVAVLETPPNWRWAPLGFAPIGMKGETLPGQMSQIKCISSGEAYQKLARNGWYNFDKLLVSALQVRMTANLKKGQREHLRLDRCTGKILERLPA